MLFIHKSRLRKNPIRLCIIVGLAMGCVYLTSCIPISNPPPEPTPTPQPTSDDGIINVSVFDQFNNPMMSGVIVRVANSHQVDGDDYGMLRLISCNDGQYITAWAVGYYISVINCHANATEYSIRLTPINVSNNTVLSWISAGRLGDPFPNCSACHSNPGSMNEYSEWQDDGHGMVFRDPYFWTMYLGSDVNLNRGENTRWTLDGQGNQIRLLPDPSRSYFGPGFKLDYPSEDGNCAYCHAPVSAIGSQVRMDLTQTISEARSGQSGAFTEGVNCDICHKVVNVKLGNDNKPFPDKPGVLSFEFIHEDRLLFMGSQADAMDITVPELNVSCAPVFSQSRFCAPCHTFKFYGTQIYDSYGEWLASSYADPKNDKYRTCQSCHMLPTDVTNLAEAPPTSAREACSQYNSSFSDFNHNMMLRGEDTIPLLVKQAATLKVKPEIKDGKINLTVIVTNTNAGHKFPTDSPLRHLILVIEATTEYGARLPLIEGQTIPPWGGVGNRPEDYAGKPGAIYANILMDTDTYLSPTAAYWNQVQPAWDKSDTRIPPETAVESVYTFPIPPNRKANFHVKLIYRQAFIDLARQKGWPINDIIAVEAEATIP